MRILADYHHSDLFESLALLFEDRFGWELYAPYGMQWFDEGVWNFERQHHGDAVARQYLDGVWAGAQWHLGGHYYVKDATHPGRIRKGVALEQAREQKWDVVLSSLPDNDQGLWQLAQDTGAKFGVQIGNQAQYSNWGLADFGLVSSNMEYEPAKPHVIYRQEFRLTDFRYEWPPEEPRSVASFIQCFAENKDFYAEFLDYARDLADEFDWKVYGAYGSHPADEFACGNLGSTPDVAAAMRKTRIAWHSKWWSDGYGHVIHNLFACGKPVVGYADYYQNKLAGPLWQDGVNSLDLSRHSRDEVIAWLRRLRDDDDFHWQVSDASAKRFAEVVDFDEDAEKVKGLLESVL